MKAYYLCFITSLFCAFILTPASLYAAEIAEQDILDAILGVRSFTDEQLKAMDLNGDGKVDVADVVYFKKPIADFSVTTSEVDESVGSHVVSLHFNQPITGVIKYTVGGTAAANEDYDALPGSINVSGNSANIQIAIRSDSRYEGGETIILSLLPGKDYLLGAKRSHTVTLKDNPNQSGADYLFTLSSLTPGVEGSTTEKKGFPGTLFSRTASVNITFSQSNVLSAFINVKKSIGIKDTITQAETIPAKSVSYSPGKLDMVFEYHTQYDSFVSDPSLINFDPDKPSLGNQTKKMLTNTLTLTIKNTVTGDNPPVTSPFDIAKDKLAFKYLEGNFSLAIAGVLNEGTGQFFEGILRGTMQP